MFKPKQPKPIVIICHPKMKEAYEELLKGKESQDDK